LDLLKSEHGELVKALFEEFKKNVEITNIETELKSEKEKVIELEKENTTLKATATEKDTQIENLTKSEKELKAKLDEKEVTEKLAEKKSMITKTITESKLPKEAVTDIFVEDLMSLEEKEVEGKTVTVEEQVKIRIEDRKKLINKKSGDVINSGDEFVEDVEESDKEIDIDESTKQFEKDLK